MVPLRKRSSSSPVIVLLLLCLAFNFPANTESAGLTVGFYDKTCPQAEKLVNQAVTAGFASTAGAAAAQIIRLHFHDCFVRGCDASVLLDSTATNSAEQDAAPNLTLKGFNFINNAKSAIEAVCPHTVSCADILAFAARDSIALAGNITYQVPAGRRDGTISHESEAESNLPDPHFNATQLIANFATKNLTAEDMVILSGAHTVGVSHCGAFLNRLYSANGTSQVDPTLSGGYALLLQAKCPPNVASNDSRIVAMDIVTPAVLDNKYYIDLLLTLGLFTSDQALLTRPALKSLVTNFSINQGAWLNKFVTAMVKMGSIQVMTGGEGEIRTNCSVINKGLYTASELIGSNVGSDQIQTS